MLFKTKTKTLVVNNKIEINKLYSSHQKLFSRNNDISKHNVIAIYAKKKPFKIE